jgi:hypothetical protein
MPPFLDVFELAGLLLRAAGFLVAGYALGRFTQDAYQKAAWQLQAALALGFFALLAALTRFSSPGSAGAFALGAGAAFLIIGGAGKERTIARNLASAGGSPESPRTQLHCVRLLS